MPPPSEPGAAERGLKAFSGKRSELVALLGAFSFLLSAIEFTFPKPLPFVRLGIANLPLLLAVDLLPLPSYLLLATVKFVGMSLVSGTLFSYVALFSAAGSFASALAMWLARRLGGRAISHLGVSVTGAMLSSAAQIALARALIFGDAALYIAPLFFASSLLTGSLLGLFASRFVASSRWYARHASGTGPPLDATTISPPGAEVGSASRSSERGRLLRQARAEGWDRRFAPAPLAVTAACVALSLLFQPNIWFRALVVLLLAFAVRLSGRRIGPLATLVVTLSIVLANLVVPVGRLLFRIGPLLVTATALVEGLAKALAFQGLIFASKAGIRPALRFPGRIGALVSEAFAGYQSLLESGGKLRPGRFVEDTDALLLGLEARAAGAALGEAGAAEPERRGVATELFVVIGSSLALLGAGLLLRA